MDLFRKQSDRSRVANHAVALETWENEGGAVQAPSDGQRDWRKTVAQREAYILQHLGAALLSQWNNFPPHLQHELFEQSVAAAACDDTVEARKGIAQFLHVHKDDAEGGAQ